MAPGPHITREQCLDRIQSLIKQHYPENNITVFDLVISNIMQLTDIHLAFHLNKAYGNVPNSYSFGENATLVIYADTEPYVPDIAEELLQRCTNCVFKALPKLFARKCVSCEMISLSEMRLTTNKNRLDTFDEMVTVDRYIVKDLFTCIDDYYDYEDDDSNDTDNTDNDNEASLEDDL